MTEQIVSPERFAAGLNTRQLACRELGHVWVPWSVAVVHAGKRIGGFVRTMKCRQCKSERRQTLDGRGHVVSNGYVYAGGYLATNVERGTLSRDTFRLEAVTRWVEGHASEVRHLDDSGSELQVAS